MFNRYIKVTVMLNNFSDGLETEKGKERKRERDKLWRIYNELVVVMHGSDSQGESNQSHFPFSLSLLYSLPSLSLSLFPLPFPKRMDATLSLSNFFFWREREKFGGCG